MEYLIIDRNEWQRGNIGNGKLINRFTNKKCCLGFLCLADGISVDEIIGESMLPESFAGKGFAGKLLLTFDNLRVLDSNFASFAARINDAFIGETIKLNNEQIELESEEQREQMLIELFLNNSIKLSFIN